MYTNHAAQSYNERSELQAAAATEPFNIETVFTQPAQASRLSELYDTGMFECETSAYLRHYSVTIFFIFTL